MMSGKVLLSFDVEEFDLPKEHGEKITLEEGVEVSSGGLERILGILERTGVKVTFFCTGNFVKNRQDLIRRIQREGHEIACHGVDHFKPRKSDLEESKKIVEKTIGCKVFGYRQPRMFKIDYKELKRCKYEYDSSVNPAIIPGRYNNAKMPRCPFVRDGVLEIPASVTGVMRIPLFWLALHLFPLPVYYRLAWGAIRKDGQLVTYFHPWEFAELDSFKVVPWFIKRNSGKKLVNKLEKLINKLKRKGCEFVTCHQFSEEWKLNNK